MSNPFGQNPWESNNSGPAYGNAYEDDQTTATRYGNQNQQAYNSAYSTYQTNNVPTNNNYGQPTNAWESNKTEYPANNGNNAWEGPNSPPISQTPVQQSALVSQDAYRYTGTPYGNQPPQVTTNLNQNEKEANNNLISATEPEREYHTPNKWRFWYRFLTLITSVGHLGFAAGAEPYSGQEVPFYTSACFYYLFAVAILSIIWSGYHVFYYCYRRALKKDKFNRPIMFAIDLLMAVLWGVGIIVEICLFRCTDGSAFCNFYNVSIFWGFTTFVLYLLGVGWDVIGACSSGRKRRA
ncbi:hypothetical protein K501DRAFT_309919 [Backusella circina FSU 941]|nr:hypothetical protein K501DRAFT_309919 [Backusella circina FSU 941]